MLIVVKSDIYGEDGPYTLCAVVLNEVQARNPEYAEKRICKIFDAIRDKAIVEKTGYEDEG